MNYFMFMESYKYPRTFHLPWSPGVSSDDKIIESLEVFKGREVVISEKMDGENSSLYPNGHIHARSMDSVITPWRTWLKAWWNERCFKLAPELRVCGEDLFALHSIKYEGLGSYFRGFSLWEGPICLSWDDTLLWFEELGVTPVRVIYRGIWDENLVRTLKPSDGEEGFVVRVSDSFTSDQFKTHVAKYVRANHVQTDDRWDEGEIIRNGL